MSFFPAGRAPLNAGPADLGRRLRVVHNAGFSSGETTTVGVLYRWSGGYDHGIVRLRTREGRTWGIRTADIIEARVVAPEVSAFDMQRLAEQGWPPIEAESMGEWELRRSCGATGRCNSVRACGPPSRSLRSALSFTRDWYAERDLDPLIQLPMPSGLDTPLGELGWARLRSSRLMTNSVARLLSATAAARERLDLDIQVRDEPNPEWYSLVTGYGPDTAEEFEHVMRTVQPAAFVFCRNTSGDLLGIGRATLQDTWAGATNMETLQQSRRSGIATAVLARLALWAHEQGANDWYLQVFHDNSAARSFYERFGFSTHHHYEYWGYPDSTVT